jgi:muramoyltetrapeptide carboxypeptidase
MLRGAGEPVDISARLERGELADAADTASFVGGNLTVLSTLLGTPFEPAIDPEGKWLLLEDYHDKPERMDRFLSHLSLAGYFRRCAGVLLGDFHIGDRDLLPTILAILDYHLPADRSLPVLSTRQIGHTWPMTPLALHTPAQVIVADKDRARFVFSPHAFAMIDAV